MGTVSDYRVLSAPTPELLERQVNELLFNASDPLNDTWQPHGPMHCVTRHAQNRFSGMQHKDTVYSIEYTQAMVRVMA